LLEAEEDYNNAKKEWEKKDEDLRNELKEANDELLKFKQKAEKSEKNRRDSVSQLQDDMWKHLVETDEDNKKERKKLQGDLKTSKDEINALKARITYLEASKLQMIEECSRQMNLLRTGVRIMNGQ